jgi:hypothetical protein
MPYLIAYGNMFSIWTPTYINIFSIRRNSTNTFSSYIESLILCEWNECKDLPRASQIRTVLSPEAVANRSVCVGSQHN